MTDLFEFVIIFALSLFLILWAVFLIKRLIILLRLRSLRRIPGVVVKPGVQSLIFSKKVTKVPCYYISVGGKTYDIYFFNPGGSWRHAHIASERFAVSFSKFGSDSVRRPSANVFSKMNSFIPLGSGVFFAKTRLLPVVNPKKEHIPVLIFSPIPEQLTYVTQEKTSIKIAFTGEKVGVWQIFTAKTFFKYIDRASRGFFPNHDHQSDE